MVSTNEDAGEASTIEALSGPSRIPADASGSSDELDDGNFPNEPEIDNEIRDDVSSNTSDIESQDSQASKHVLRWYRTTHPRFVDLVGDYAGNELFLIEGDSLLLHCFAAPDLDFQNGYQLLHATFLVERFLQALLQRKCNFHIAFFDENKWLSLPSTSSPLLQEKCVFARAAIIRHLQINLGKTDPNVQINEFCSLRSRSFRDYLMQTGMYFVMCHDGALAENNEAQVEKAGKEPITRESDKVVQSDVARRVIIAYFLRDGYNVALINGLKWHDTKVMTAVLESPSRTVPFFELCSPHFDQQLPEYNANSLLDQEIPKLREYLDANKTLTEREVLSVLVVRAIFPGSQPDIEVMVTSFLYHSAMLRHLPLHRRSINSNRASEETDTFLQKLLRIATEILHCDRWPELMQDWCISCDVGDFVDGRLLNACSEAGRNGSLALQPGIGAAETWKLLTKLAAPQFGKSLAIKDDVPLYERQSSQFHAPHIETGAVLPFSNHVFDTHMESIRLSIDKSPSSELSRDAATIFRELSHWHNAKRPLTSTKANPTPQTQLQELKAQKRNQRFMAEMQNYSASLTHSVGGSLKRETIQVDTSTNGQGSHKNISKKYVQNKQPADKSSGGTKPEHSKKNKNAGKRAREEKLEAEQSRKAEEKVAIAISAWQNSCRVYEAQRYPQVQYTSAKGYLDTIDEKKREIIGAEVKCYMLNALLRLWISQCRTNDKNKGFPILALAFDTIRSIETTPGLTRTVVNNVKETIKALGFSQMSFRDSSVERPLPFQFSLAQSRGLNLTVHPSPLSFQLAYCGPYMDRNFDDAPDDRVPFRPDGWQRKVLDEIDAGHSLLVVAPTSAGKTFISFYAMRQVLRASNEGVLVYVAPTKALVNQIAAEIEARFSKTFPHGGGKSVWAIHTRDYRINNPTGCQVLVTVPHVLQIMLLSPSNAGAGDKSWSNRVKRIIFDEVHSIGQAEDGVVWEQLLLLAPCPIIALSATIGNPESFSDWLESTQKSLGHELTMVRHPYRYSDLRKFVYSAPTEFPFAGLPEPVDTSFARLGLDEARGFAFLHPVASLVNKSRGIPDDLHLEARDCETLWQAMKRHQVQGEKRWDVPDKLDPESQLPSVVRKIDVIKWEAGLKEVLRSWMADNSSPFDKVLDELSKPINRPIPSHTSNLRMTTLPLLCSLHEQDALPALLFNYNRTECEAIARTVLSQLKHAEDKYKATPKFQKRVKEKEDWEKAKALEAAKKTAKKPIKGKKGDEQDDGLTSKEMQRDAAETDFSSIASFDPEAPLDKFSFANTKKLSEDLDEIKMKLHKRGIDLWLIAALCRGIGVHHAGMNRGYRQTVEMLFRAGFLRVVIATGTLALGINMPTRTVVFSGDSVFLTALNYRQAAGRAGRRGFDVLGNVVFHGVTPDKVCRLVSSRLPELNGHFPITTTLVLRLFSLLHESKNSPFAVRAINSLLSQPRLYMGSSERKTEVLHHLRFSIEYLRRQHLLDSTGAPLNFAGCLAHLYYTENSSFAFHALLKGGYFHELCRNIRKNPPAILETLMLIMSHIFGRHECRRADKDFIEDIVKRSSSVVFLPKLPEQAVKILRAHNQETLDIFSTYVKTYVDQHMKEPETCLPLTKVKIGGDMATMQESSLPVLPPTKVRSAFVALSGHDDHFRSISDLCRTARDGVFLEEAVIPHVDIYPEETDTPLNAYLYDFFRNGSVQDLARANGIRKGDVWFALNDFSLVLATIVTSLQNFMKLTDNSDMDMLDLKGAFDAREDSKDNDLFEAEEGGEEAEQNLDSEQGPSQMRTGYQVPSPSSTTTKKMKAKKVADSWEDDDAEDEQTPVDTPPTSPTGTLTPSVEMHSSTGIADVGEGKGLLLVLEAFIRLKKEFDEKFRAIWA
ncbi:P-loop containing nucleoside triphosphate hydrolase protein [Viridothelium virens]|uniref:P-loop containing nucleoside triphosphate hydrolase protein n=1 Tax=Viridothelium virens TaxID=1048519 RepID=A0A6A6HDK2_VIRVR|nr:P-loop containing nucleoside triphosphate hydrolase protein [Viridothelium virens]